MKTFYSALTACGVAAASVSAQPVQWRVEDGGNGHWYQFVHKPTPLAWHQAADEATGSGGHLATLTSATENAWVRDQIVGLNNPGGGEAGPYIGAHCEGRAWGDWIWVTGEPWGFAGWGPGEPNSGGGERFVHFWNWTGIWWNDTVSDAGGHTHSYVLEWDADCNGDGIVDKGQILSGQLGDADGNGVPDVCVGRNHVLALDNGGYVGIPDNATQSTPNAITIEYWAKLSSNSMRPYARPFQKRHGSGGQFSVNFRPAAPSEVELFGVGVTPGFVVPTDTWTHFAVTWSAASQRARVYLNGAMVTDDAVGAGPMNGYGGELRFGDTGEFGTWLFQGRLDNIRFWNVERTQAEIQANASRQFSQAEAASATGLIGSWSFEGGDATDAKGQNSGVLYGTAVVVEDSAWQPTPNCALQAAWSRVVSPVSPPARWTHVMAATGPGGDGSVVMFGGIGANPLGGSTYLDDTWVWNGVNWNSSPTPEGLLAREGHAMAGSPGGKIVLFGGLTEEPIEGQLLSAVGDTWEWSSGAWTEASITGPRPTPRGGATATLVTGPLVQLPFTLMFGGFRPLGNSVNETWKWNGSSWNQVPINGSWPAPRWGAAMAYDPGHSRVIMFGGWDTSRFSDTWSFDPATNLWTELHPAHVPAGRVDHVMAYDARRQRIVMYGDLNFSTSDQWSWNGSDWEPDAVCGPDMWVTAMAPDVTGKLVLFGGSGNRGVSLSNETWRSDSGPCVCVPTDPVDSTPGSTVVLTAESCSAGGTGPTTYVWKRSGTPAVSLPRISASADGSELSINNAQLSDSGEYYVEATNACGTTLTRPVQVRVCGVDVGRAGGVPGRDGTLDTNDFIVFIDWFFTSDARADRGVQGGIPGTDGHFDNNDFVVFIDQFFAGCT